LKDWILLKKIFEKLDFVKKKYLKKLILLKKRFEKLDFVKKKCGKFSFSTIHLLV